MKKYVKPLMESETFVTNEFVSACGDINSNYTCMDMGSQSNNFTTIIVDTNKNGRRDTGENTVYTYNDTNVTYADDCGQNGGAVHTITSTENLPVVLVYTSETDYTPAYVVEHTESGKHGTSTRPHFISFTTYNHS